MSMRLPALPTALFWFVVSAPSLALAAWAGTPASGKYSLEALSGEKYAVVESTRGRVRAVDGMELHPGDRVRTGFHTSAKVVYPDGTKLVLGHAADMTVGEQKDGVQYNDVEFGEIRAKVAKDAQSSGKKIHFIIRTRSAVMGVRGTDFMFKQERKAVSQVYTFEGLLDVAHTEPELFGGKAVAVGYHQMVEASPAAITQPKPFEPKLFLASVSKDDPEMTSQVQADAQSFHEDYPEPFSSGMSWLDFRLNGIYVYQSAQNYSYSGELSWDPAYRFNSRLSLGGHVGGFVLKGATEDDRFVGLEMGVLAGLYINSSLSLEAGGGAENWTSNHGNTGPLLMANVAWKVEGGRWLDRIFVGVSDYLKSPDGTPQNGTRPAYQFKAGVGLSL